ncbi:MAG: DUF4403 family protein [Myxococcales bacterium]|nr:DUF4403 family protein [Myxococcales bacterium]
MNVSTRLPLLAALATAAGALGCSHALQVPRPPPGTPSRPPPLEASRIDVPLESDVRSTLAGLEREVPRTFSTQGRFQMLGVTPVGVRYEVTRSDFRFSVEGDRLVAETELSVQAEACVGAPGGLPIPLLGGVCQPVASCGVNEARRRVVIRTATQLGLTPEWQIVSRTEPAGVRFVDRCELTAFRVDVTNIASDFVVAQMRTATHQMDARIAERGDLRPRAERFWASLQAPVDLGEGFWLTLSPRRVFAAPITLSPERVSTHVGIETVATVTTGGRPDTQETRLPALEMSDAAGSNRFSITFDARVGFDEINALVGQEFRGRTMQLSGHDVLIRDIRARASEAAMLFELDVRFTDPPFGNTAGTVYLAGLPAFDAASSSMVVRNVDYTLETRNALLSAGEWFMRGSLREDVARRAVFPLGARIDRLRTQAQTALTRELVPGTALRGQITGVRPASVFVTDDGVLVRVNVDGEARVTQNLDTLGLTAR